VNDVRHAPPAPPWITVPGIAAQGCGMFLLPMVVGFVSALLLESTQVIDTGPWLLGLTALLLFPIALAQLVGLIMKSTRDLRYWRSRGGLGFTRLLDVFYTHLSVVTLRGWTLLLVGTFLTFVALFAKWAEFGLMAVIGLFLFYAVTGWTVFASTFLVRGFDASRSARRSFIARAMVPTVVQTGDVVDEVFTFKGVPIPWGYLLVVEDPLPVRLKTESRYVVGGAARSGAEARGRLRSTPRGHYFVGPARLWYQDLLGITRVSLSATAAAELKVLPRFRSVVIEDPPRSGRKTPDVVTRPNRQATEDWFRFREYANGDDTRRIHWRLSLRSGHLQVRQPETREIQTQEVLLVLDTFMPPTRLADAALGADDILDGLVEAWLGIVKTLIDNGDRVSIAAAVGGHDDNSVAIETVRCVKGESARWQDLGARARWQAEFDVPKLLEDAGERIHAVVVTGRFVATPPGPLPGKTITWLFLDPSDALGRPDPHWLVQIVGGPSLLLVFSWLFRLPYPAGDEENAAVRRIRSSLAIIRLHQARAALRSMAIKRVGATVAELRGRGDAVFRIDRKPTHIALIGLQGTKGTDPVRRAS
jgi:uncharacterized protein (DUF58 family)